MEIRNKTKRPLRVPLPGGKQLHLGPGKTGQIVPKAAEHPPVKELIEDGSLEVIDPRHSKGGGPDSSVTGLGPSEGGASGGSSLRKTGDR